LRQNTREREARAFCQKTGDTACKNLDEGPTIRLEQRDVGRKRQELKLVKKGIRANKWGHLLRRH